MEEILKKLEEIKTNPDGLSNIVTNMLGADPEDLKEFQNGMEEGIVKMKTFLQNLDKETKASLSSSPTTAPTQPDLVTNMMMGVTDGIDIKEFQIGMEEGIEKMKTFLQNLNKEIKTPSSSSPTTVPTQPATTKSDSFSVPVLTFSQISKILDPNNHQSSQPKTNKNTPDSLDCLITSLKENETNRAKIEQEISQMNPIDRAAFWSKYHDLPTENERILANQTAIVDNQDTIMKNQASILEQLSDLALEMQILRKEIKTIIG